MHVRKLASPLLQGHPRPWHVMQLAVLLPGVLCWVWCALAVLMLGVPKGPSAVARRGWNAFLQEGRKTQHRQMH